MDHLTQLEEMLDRANGEIKNGKYEAASNILEQMIEIDPSFGKTYNHMGFLYDVKFKEYEKADTLYKLCLEKSPMYPSVYYNYAVLLSTLQKWQELQTLLDDALLVPGVNKSTIFNEYAIMYEQMGRLDDAMAKYREAGMNTLDKNVLDRVKASIERCKSKKELF
jgi:Tfp pilus assembly protein PilF